MSRHAPRARASLPILVILLSTVATLSQMPSLARLIVQSNPRGAQISVNGKQTGQTTNAMFVVAPGDYTVSLSGAAKCPDQNVSLHSGQTITMICTNENWTVH